MVQILRIALKRLVGLVGERTSDGQREHREEAVAEQTDHDANTKHCNLYMLCVRDVTCRAVTCRDVPT